jgi:hypothetical protein
VLDLQLDYVGSIPNAAKVIADVRERLIVSTSALIALHGVVGSIFRALRGEILVIQASLGFPPPDVILDLGQGRA